MAAILKKKRSWRRKQVFFFLSLRRDFLCHTPLSRRLLFFRNRSTAVPSFRSRPGAPSPDSFFLQHGCTIFTHLAFNQIEH